MKGWFTPNIKILSHLDAIVKNDWISSIICLDEAIL